MKLLSDWRTQVLLWGWACNGHDDLAMFVAETPWRDDYRWWDKDRAWLDTQRVAHGDEPYHLPPDHWALPGVTELRIRREQDFWDIAKEEM